MEGESGWWSKTGLRESTTLSQIILNGYIHVTLFDHQVSFGISLVPVSDYVPIFLILSQYLLIAKIKLQI